MIADDACTLAEDRIARWVREHAAAVRGYVLALVGKSDVADDLVQEVFQRAWQARERYRDKGFERAYLLRIADRLVVDRSRRARHEVNLDDAAWHEVEPASQSGVPFDDLARREVGDELTMALDQLTPAQKRVLLLRFFGDLSFEEIAEMIGCPLGTALSHCRRGLIALRGMLATKTP
jgi:RNA polymerase sigma-70 factor (ECF subfamily)